MVTGKVPSASGFPAIVVLAPRAPRTLPAPMRPKTMDQIGYAFVPGLLVVQAGQPTRFHNSEDVLHNVRVTESATQEPVFNIATVLEGSYDHTFERPGFYTVTCDVHQDMRADILVTSTPYAIVAEKDGAFMLSDVPTGPYTLTVHLGGQRMERAVDVTAPRTEIAVEPSELQKVADR
jgi:plastocyanin